MKVQVYGIMTGDRVHYIGSTKRLSGRAAMHRRNYAQLFAAGAEIKLLIECEVEDGYRLEAELIQDHWNRGQCELNKNLPGNGTRTYKACQVKDRKTGEIYRSIEHAAEVIGYSRITLLRLFELGRLTFDLEAAADWRGEFNPNFDAVTLGRMARGKTKNISEEERQRRRERAAHARQVRLDRMNGK